MPRIRLVEPYWDFWERSVPYDLRADRAAIGEAVRRAVEGVLPDAVWAAEAEAADVVLVLQTMATPPAWTLPLLGDLPVVIWAAHRTAMPSGLDHGSITTEGATVGAPMLTNVLVREGRPFELVLGRVDDPATLEAVAGALRAAAAGHRMRRARIGRVGRPLDGYAAVDTDDELLRRRTGIELVPIDPAEVLELYREVTPERVAEMERETRERYAMEIEGDGLQRSLRAACAIDDLVARHRLDAGAMNGHVPEIRYGEEIGVAPSFALGRSTTNGVPWTEVGDVLTAVAMLAGTWLGGGAQYHELEAVDYDTGELVLASSGEFDLALAQGGTPRLIVNDWYASDPIVGACAEFTAPAGEATLIAFTQVGDRYRLIAGEGEFTGRAFPATGTPNGGFRFTRGLGAWTDWCRAGANHHSSATHGALGPALETLGRFLDVEIVRV